MSKPILIKATLACLAFVFTDTLSHLSPDWIDPGSWYIAGTLGTGVLLISAFSDWKAGWRD